MAGVTARAFTSTANLGHGLDVLGLCLDVASDDVTARVAAAGAGMTIRATGVAAEAIPTDPERNTAGRAVRALCAAHDLREDLELHIRKGVRPGSGLGSSAASAAAAVLAVSRLSGLDLAAADLVRFAAEGETAAAGAAHADNVAASLLGGFVLLTEQGPRVLASADPPRFAVVFPAISVSTAEARAALPGRIEMAAHIGGLRGVAATVAAWQAGDAVALGRSVEGGLADACRARFIRGFDEAVSAGRSAGASGVCISGAGPTLLAFCPPSADPLQIGAAMQAALAGAGVSADVFAAEVGPPARVVEQA